MLNHREFALLVLISEEPSYPYEINKKIDERGMRNWTKIGTTSIYSNLNNLEESGFVKSYNKNHENRMRSIYHITEKGWETLKEKLHEVFKEFRGKYVENFYVAFLLLSILSKKEQVEAIF
ncbi:MAG: PadR family transcriptional regulator [Promethearchaeota archaeon]